MLFTRPRDYESDNDRFLNVLVNVLFMMKQSANDVASSQVVCRSDISSPT